MDDLLAARWQMALSLGFHIIYACIGMVMPFFMAVSHYRWLRSGSKSKTGARMFFSSVALKQDAAIKFMTYTTEEKLTFDSLQLTPYQAIHSPQTHPHSLRLVADNKVVAYSGDTEWTEDLLLASKGADLFICEASSYEKYIKYHLSVKHVLGQMERIEAKRIVLTHLGEEALKHTDEIPLTVAADGMVLMDD